MPHRAQVFAIVCILFSGACAGEKSGSREGASDPATRGEGEPSPGPDGSRGSDASVPDDERPLHDGGLAAGPSRPLPSPIRIVPLGDSLTFGTSASAGASTLHGGYRIRLRELLTNEGYEVDYVGSSRNGPTGFDGEHVSREGASIAAVEELWAEAGPTLSPHVVLLMAGTNDALGITADQPPEPAARALGALIDRIASDQPDARIVVSTLIPLVQRFWLVGADNAARVPVFNALVEELVAEKRAAGVHVHLADLSGIDGDALGDGIHPSEMATYEEMAELWFPAVVEAIEALREPSS